MSMPRLFSVNALADLTEKDRRAIKKLLRDTPPDASTASGPKWRVSTLIRLIEAQQPQADAYSKQRNRLLRSKANMAAFAEQQQRDMWVHINEVRASWLAIVNIAKTNLRNIPAKVAPRVILCKSAGEAAIILRKEIDAVLTALSQTKIVALPPDDGADPQRSGQLPDDAATAAA